MRNLVSSNSIVILQPGYLPWLGFFDLLDKAGIFVILDDVQYTARDWRNRNRIKTSGGANWLTVPVSVRKTRNTLIKDVKIDNTQNWQRRHLRTLESVYKKAAYYHEIIELIIDVYQKNYRFLVEVDMDFILRVKSYLSINTDIKLSSEIVSSGQKDEKLLSICTSLNAGTYISGVAAKDYLRERIFNAEGITVEWHNYQHPYYNQLWLREHGFISHLSIVDLLFNHGPASHSILTGRKIISKPQAIRLRHADDFLR